MPESDHIVAARVEAAGGDVDTALEEQRNDRHRETVTTADLRLTDAHLIMRPGGTVTYRAAVERETGDMTGAWVGWIGDATDTDGARRWWAEWRENGDPAPRWHSGPVFDTVADARDALINHRAAR